MKISGAVLALALLATACTTTPVATKKDPAIRTMQQMADEVTVAYQYVAPPDADLVPGINRLVFVLLDADGALAAGVTAQMYYARSELSAPMGPVPISFADDGLGDKAFYKAEVGLDSAGKWLILIVEETPGGKQGVGGTVTVKGDSPVPTIGEQAISVKSPTTSNAAGVEDICTREPQDPMHELSLDDALTNGKPTVVTFGTPKFCESRVCGPVVEQVLKVREKLADEANFIHIEVFTDDSLQQYAPAFRAWRFATEPWTFVIDAKGIVRARFEGPVTTTEVEEALRSLQA